VTERKLTAIAITNQFVHWFTMGLVIPVFAIFQVDRGLTLSQVGLNVAVLSVVIAVLELPTGGLSDTLGRRNVYMLSLGAQLVAAGILVVAFHPLLIIVGFFFLGTARALSSGCMDAYFVDAFGEADGSGDLQRFLAKLGAAIPLALAVGGVVGGYVADTSFAIRSDHLVVQLDQYSLLFLVVIAVILMQVLLTMLLIPTEAQRPGFSGFVTGVTQLPATMKSAYRHALSNRIVLLLLLGTASWGIAFSALEQYWQPFVNSLTAEDSPTRLFGFLSGGYFLVGAVGSLAANGVFRLVGPRYATTIVVLRIVIGASFLVLALTESVATFAVVYFVLFFLNGISSSPEQTLLNKSIPGEVRSTVLSVESLFMQAGGGIAALVWGIVSQYYGIALAWQLAGGIFLLSGAFYLFIARRGEISSE
jgi:MFS family permease